jgi:hypothetical protein
MSEKIGYSTWASSLPKEYLAKYVLMAGTRQAVIVDDLLPLAYKERDDATQERNTKLYITFLSQLQSALSFVEEATIIPLSERASLRDLVKVANHCDIDPVVTMPQEKRKSKVILPFQEYIHPLYEFLAYSILEEEGVEAIIRGSGQQGLVNEYKKLNDSIRFSCVPTEKTLLQCANQLNHSENSVTDLLAVVDMWRSAELLKVKKTDVQMLSKPGSALLEKIKEVQHEGILLVSAAEKESQIIVITNRIPKFEVDTLPQCAHFFGKSLGVIDIRRKGQKRTYYHPSVLSNDYANVLVFHAGDESTTSNNHHFDISCMQNGQYLYLLNILAGTFISDKNFQAVELLRLMKTIVQNHPELDILSLVSENLNPNKETLNRISVSIEIAKQL